MGYNESVVNFLHYMSRIEHKSERLNANQLQQLLTPRDSQDYGFRGFDGYDEALGGIDPDVRMVVELPKRVVPSRR